MKKKSDCFRETPWKPIKMIRIMKLTIMLMLVGILQLSANVSAQNGKMNVQVTNMQLSDLLWQLQEESDIVFIYQTDDLKDVDNISLERKEASITEILDAVLIDTNLEYTLDKNVVVIKKKEAEPKVIEVQQERKIIKGTVTDADGEGIPGVSVVIKGTTNGTATGVDGKYRLKLDDENAVLVFSFVGMELKEIKYTGQSIIDAQLEADSEQMDEVVVTGYFKQARESYTGSAKTVTSDELEAISNQNILTTLSVIDPSFQLVQNDVVGSDPNSTPEFQIRGSSSLRSEFEGSPNMPVFILDGFHASVQKIYDLDPTRIKSFTILKDAAATAIYGSRAANGVVVINTVPPKKGKLDVTYKGDYTLEFPDLRDYDLLNAKEKLEYETLAGLYESNSYIPNIESANAKYNERLKLVKQGYDTDWLRKPLEDYAISHKHSLKLQGGGDSFRYGVNLFYNDIKGVMKESGRTTKSINIDLHYNLKNLSFKNSFTYSQVSEYKSPYGSYTQYTRMNPYLPYSDENGELLQVVYNPTETPDQKIYNPLYNAQLSIIDEKVYDEFTNNFSIDWKLLDGLKIRSQVSISKKISSSDKFLPKEHSTFGSYSGDNIIRKGRYTASNTEQTSFTANTILSYYKKLNDHVITFNGGWDLNMQESDKRGFIAEGFPNENLRHPSLALQFAQGSTPTGNETIKRSVGALSTFNYNYNNKYFVDLSLRYDGSSLFGSENRWGKFWSYGAGWNIHNEKFIKDLGVVNKFKIRASHGLTGSQSFNPSQALLIYKYMQGQVYYNGVGTQLLNYGNSDLGWQVTKKNNLGFDFAFFKYRLSGSVDFYVDLSTDLLVDVSLPPSLGFASYKDNLGEVENKGWEANLKYSVIKKKDIRLDVFGSVFSNKNKIKKISNALSSYNETAQEGTSNKPSVLYIEGESIKTIWVVKSLGIDPATGSEVFLTKDGEKTFTWNADDYVPYGSTDPDLMGNFGTLFRYKNFQMNMIFKFRLGGQQYNKTLVDRVENVNPIYNVDKRAFTKRWKQPGDIASFKSIKDQSNTKPTSRFVQDDNSVDINSINLSYYVRDSKFVDKLGLENLKFSVYMNDIYRWSSIKQERGLSYPYSKKVSFSIKTNF
jgi:TonB-linked SusC/RagA family outer membrane protein